jgi:hypothetical protein
VPFVQYFKVFLNNISKQSLRVDAVFLVDAITDTIEFDINEIIPL